MFFDLPPPLNLVDPPAICRKCDLLIHASFLPGAFGDHHSSAAAVPVDITLTANTVSTTNAQAYTFNTQATGTAASDRCTIVAAGATDSGFNIDGVTSVTVDGNAATLATESANPNRQCFPTLRYIANATGTTSDIVVTWSTATPDNCGVCVFRKVGGTSNTPTATGVTESITANRLRLNLTIPANGGAIGYVIASGDGGVRTWTWTNMTEAFDQTVESAISHSGAIFHTAGTADRDCTASGLLQSGNYVAAVWG